MSIGIRREDKHQWEARVPITPDGVRELAQHGLQVVIQPSTVRAFSDDDYREAGAVVREEITGSDVVFAVKEIPTELLRKGGAYVFFSHVIKGQTHNMPMLRRLMELGCTLVDYEKITDHKGRRLVFFGRHAGLAGMIDTLHVLGQRWRALGRGELFGGIELAHTYPDLHAAQAAIRSARPTLNAPFVVGFAGYGNVSQGAQEIFDLLAPTRVEPSELAEVREPGLYKVEFKERDLVEAIEGEFELQEYYDHPERYRSVFTQHAPHLDVLVNAIYWTEAYPRLLSNDFLRETPLPRLIVVGDISCDINGAVQCTVKSTTPGEPAYVYNPATGDVRDGVTGPGVCLMTTDCLPCELPRESSSAFNEALLPLVPEIAAADYGAPFEMASLPDPIRRATILWRGELTADYRYLTEFL